MGIRIRESEIRDSFHSPESVSYWYGNLIHTVVKFTCEILQNVIISKVKTIKEQSSAERVERGRRLTDVIDEEDFYLWLPNSNRRDSG